MTPSNLIANRFYYLAEDVKNPKADRRSGRRIVMQPVWEKGKLFFVAAHADDTLREIVFVNDHRQFDGRIDRYDERWGLIGKAAVIVPSEEETFDMIMIRIDKLGGADAHGALEQLYKSGKVTRADIESASNAWTQEAFERHMETMGAL